MGDEHGGDDINAINIISSASFFLLSVPADKHWKALWKIENFFENLFQLQIQKKSFPFVMLLLAL